MKEYLANKHRGGKNNEKGGVYESFYAVYQIVSCLAKYRHELDAVSFQTQLEDTFVDDLLIAHPDVNVYHQLKNTQNVSWGLPDKKGDIAFDFARQIEDCKDRDEQFVLKLIFSAQRSKVTEEIPEAIAQASSSEWFPYMEDMNQLVMISRELREALCSISAEGAEATDDKLADIAIVFLGVWKGIGNTQRVSLSDIVGKVESLKDVNLAIYPDTKISDECRAVLDAIDGIEYHVRGRMFYCRFGCFNASCPWPDEMESIIVEAHPKNKLELFELLH